MPAAVRALRGATTVDVDEEAHVHERTIELLEAMCDRNGVVHDDVISILFTATPDLVSEFPALAARELGLGDVPLMCATEIAVPHALPRVLRLMAHVDTPRSRDEVQAVREKSDPIERMKVLLAEQGIKEDQLKSVEQETRKLVAEAADFAESTPEPDPTELYTDVLVERY